MPRTVPIGSGSAYPISSIWFLARNALSEVHWCIETAAHAVVDAGRGAASSKWFRPCLQISQSSPPHNARKHDGEGQSSDVSGG